MSRRLFSRAAVLLLAAACSRSPAPAKNSPAAATEGETARTPGVASTAATRLTPAPPTTAPTIRPRPDPCLPGDPSAAPRTLADEARQALEGGQKQRALDCSEEALRLSPRLVAALAVRADALTDLDRLEEARLAYARALSIDPENPVTLLGAAELYVRRLSGERDALETGLEYALRGARAALRPPYRDRELAAEHQLLIGMAENDLGRNRSALAHLDRVLAVFPEDPDAVYERGVALFELCRFQEAQRTFERALSRSPDDPWVIHQLGLVAERKGDSATAERLLSRARQLDPADFAAEVAVDEHAFQAEVDAAIESLSADDRRALATVPVEIRDLPDSSDLLAVDPPLSPSILGLYRGPPEDEPCPPGEGPRCRSIVFYRKNLIRFVHTREELDTQVRITLLHELGHLHGENDDELRDRGLE